MQTITLDLPPSLNRYYRNVRGMVLISKEGREYRETARRQVIEQQIMPVGDSRIWMHVLVERADLRRADIMNMEKCLSDSLQKRDDWPGVFDDDWQIDLCTFERGSKSKSAKVIVSIGLLEGKNWMGKTLQALRGVVYAGRGETAANDDDLKIEQMVA